MILKTRTGISFRVPDSDDPGGGKAPAAVTTTPQGGNDNGQGGSGGQSQADKGGPQAGTSQAELLSQLASLQSQLAEVRKEAAGYRTKAKGFEGEVEKFKNANLTETEKLNNQVKQLADDLAKKDAQIRDHNAQSAVERAARGDAFKAVDSRAVYRLVKDDLQFNDDGQPTNVDAVLKQAKKDFPAFFGPAKPEGGGDGGTGARQTGGAFSMNDSIREMAGRGRMNGPG